MGIRAFVMASVVLGGVTGVCAQTPMPQRGMSGAFAVASVRPSAAGEPMDSSVSQAGFRARGTTLFWVIQQAYSSLPMADWREDRLERAPAWVRTERFDFDARFEQADVRRFEKLTDAQQAAALRPMLQALLWERFGLEVHETERAASVWELTVAKDLKLTPAVAGAGNHGGVVLEDGAVMQPVSLGEGRHGMRFWGVSMRHFAEVLSGLGTEEDAPIVDATKIEGRFDFLLVKRETEPAEPGVHLPPAATNWDVGALGLKLVRGRADLPTVVVDQIHELTPN